MKNHHIHKNPSYIHHQNPNVGENIREFVFGMEDGMVSTFGAITGIAMATRDPFVILLSGFVIISVESISMAVGSYLSNKSEHSIDHRMLQEEKEEIEQYPEEEKQELLGMYIRDGWSKPLASKMSEEASQNNKLFLREMAYRELQVLPDKVRQPLRNGLIMGVSYVAGGIVPLVPYLFTQTLTAIFISIGVTLVGLFALGVFVANYSKRPRLRSGGEMVLLAGVAASVGYGVGQLMERFIK